MASKQMAGMGDLIDRLESIISLDPNNTSDQVIPISKLSLNSSEHSTDAKEKITKSALEIGIILVAYSIVFIFSLLVNLLVCCIICRNRRLRTVTNSFITNLSMSDLLITLINIPVNIMRNITDEWIFGQAICKCANFILMASVYVSTFTMAAIALDRYSVIMYPLRPRVSVLSGLAINTGTWILGIVMSLPFAIFAEVTEVHLVLYTTTRCRLLYPDPSDQYERYITLGTFAFQYILPLLIIAVAYTHIVYKLWSRKLVGQFIESQQVSHLKSRRRSIKMLIIVVVMFSICWLPLNLYHILTDLHPDSNLFQYNSAVYLSFHWLAVSSVCYNPLIYCWSKETFRAELRKHLMWAVQLHPCVCVGNNQERHCTGCSTPRNYTKQMQDYNAIRLINDHDNRISMANTIITRTPKADMPRAEHFSVAPKQVADNSFFSSVGSRRTTSGVEPSNTSRNESSWSGNSQFDQWV